MVHSSRTTTSSELLTGEYIVSRVVLVGGSINSSVVLNDSTDGSGTDKLKIKALANDSKVVDLEKGMNFENGVYVTLSGTAAEVYIYYK